MKVLIHASGAVNNELEDLIFEKVETFDTYISGITKTDVFLKTKVTKMPNAKIAEIRVNLPGNQIFAEGHAGTFESAVILAANRVKKQLIKRHTIATENRIDLRDVENQDT